MPRLRLAAAVTVATAALAGCGSGSGRSSAPNPNAAEKSPPGDIPDNQVYVPYRLAGGHVVLKVPEGWARRQAAGAVTFTDKLNSVQIQSSPAQGPLTVAAAKRATRGFASPVVSTVQRP